MERDPFEGGSDVGLDLARDLGDAPPAAIRDAAPDVLAPIDADAPVSGHVPAPTASRSLADAPEHDWSMARDLVQPNFRPARDARAWPSTRSTGNPSRPTRRRATPSPSSTPARPGCPVVYTIPAGGFDIVVNGEHVLSWGIEPVELQDAALRNLATWAASAAWTEETSGERRLISSQTGEGQDAARILLPDAVAYLAGHLGDGGPGPHRPARAGPPDRGQPAPRRRRLRGPVRRVHRRAVGWRGRAHRPPRVRARRRPTGRVQRVTDGLLVEVDGAVATLTLDRPAALNALTIPVKVALREALDRDRRGPVGPGGHPDRRRPGVLRRPGPRRA